MLSTVRGLMAAVIALAATTAAASELRSDASMITGSVTSQPIGHYEFCQRHAHDCAVRSTAAPAPKLTPHGLEVVREINSRVNLSIVAMTDQEIYGKTARYQEVLIDLLADGEPRLAHLRGDADARMRVGLVLSQLDRSGYYLGVRQWPKDPAAGVAAMADLLHHFLHGEMERGGA